MRYNLEYIRQYIVDHRKNLDLAVAIGATISAGFLTYHTIDAILNKSLEEALFTSVFDIAAIVTAVLSFRDFYKSCGDSR